MVLCAACPPALQAAGECRTDSFDASVRIQYVIDGDTVALAGGERVRLIGIDAPEVGRDGAASRAGAEEATAALVNLVQEERGGFVGLVHGRERRDAHGRLLAHLFLRDGTNVQARLLAEGFAVPLIIPPNIGFVECYRRQAETARESARGLWRLPQYRATPVEALAPQTRGYRIVLGRVSRVGESRSSIWINLGDGFALRILRADLAQFAEMDLAGLRGRTVEARGMVYARNGQLRIRLRHPLDLIAVGVPGGTR